MAILSRNLMQTIYSSLLLRKLLRAIIEFEIGGKIGQDILLQ